MDKLNMKVRILIGSSLSIDDLNVLSLLYMPIIGNRAYTLYMTLYSALNRSSNTRVVELRDIIDLFGVTINTLSLDRKKLEAIGLMNTYFKDEEYVLLLKAPLSARHFFNDCILGIYLKNRVGDALFEKLLNLFKIESFNKEGYKNITETFDNVYKDKIDDDTYISTDGYLIDKKLNTSIKTGESKFDYDYFLTLLNLTLVQKHNLSAEFQLTIENTARAYNLTEEEMQMVYHRSFDQAGNFLFTKLGREAKLLKKIKDQKNTQKSSDGDDGLRFINPKDILKSKVKDATIEQYDTIDRVCVDSPYDLAITNVIIAHAISKNKMNCPDYAYFMKAIETFQQHKVKTYEEAVKFATAQGKYEKQEESKQVVENKEKKETTSSSEWLENFKKQFK